MARRLSLHVPFFLRIQRWLTICLTDILVMSLTRTRVGNFLRSQIEKDSANHIKTSPEKYHDQLVPKYSFGGKRPLSDHGYIDCTNRDNFILVQGNGIQGTTKDGKGIVDPNGKTHQIDILVLANGFHPAQLTAPMKIVGDDGIELKDYWKKAQAIRAYEGCVFIQPHIYELGAVEHSQQYLRY